MDERSRVALVDDFTEKVRQGRQLQREHRPYELPMLAHNALWQLCRLIRKGGLVSQFIQNQRLIVGQTSEGTRNYIAIGRYERWQLGMDLWGRFYLVRKRLWPWESVLTLVCDPDNDQKTSVLISSRSEKQIWRLFEAVVDGLTPIRDKLLAENDLSVSAG